MKDVKHGKQAIVLLLLQSTAWLNSQDCDLRAKGGKPI